MNFVVSSTELLSHLQAAGKVISNKNSLPIMDSFLFDLQGNTLTVTASDMETTVITSLEVESATGEGRVAIGSKRMLDTLREFSEQPLMFSIDDSNLAIVINSLNGNYNLVGQPGDEYPLTPAMTDDALFMNIAADKLLAGISKTIFAVGTDDLRQVMLGIYVDILPEGLTLVATDAHKLVKYKTKYTSASESETPMNFILPQKPASILKNILPKESGDIEVKFDSKNACFKLENYTVICRQIEGRYPNYNSVIPQNPQYRITIDRVTLLNALRRVQVYANQASNLVKCEFADNNIRISTQDIDFSTSAEENVVCQFDGEAVQIGFKSEFLIQILGNINSTEVILELIDPSRAGIILPLENETNEELLMLLMPMLLTD
jgi:DNA polymerase-3 subunit beta